ncbi:hypothetical protein [Emergencia timonensis]|uniref:hypothetical protein n=1 Tax=Emergencia timonensis TaxID=1776384 RepID=UPI0039946C3D
MSSIDHLIISSTIDYSTDLVCCELEKRGLSYLRLNRDSFSDYHLLYDLALGTLSVKIDSRTYLIEASKLRSVFFRAPVFLRNMGKLYTLQEQLQRSQWSSFLRNLIVFNRAKWINHPVSTYNAENKLYQLQAATQCGLIVPETYVGNVQPAIIDPNCMYAVKSLDAALFYENGQEMFTYTVMISGTELINSELQDAPVIIQKYLQHKTDIRVTFVGGSLFPVAITSNMQNIEDDWRKTDKNSLEYTAIELPLDLQSKLLKLMKHLQLNFGGIDLAKVQDDYYFIEVNPTGEWGWLTAKAGAGIDAAIVDLMVGGGICE